MDDMLKLGAVVSIGESSANVLIIGYYPEDENGRVYTYLGIDADAGISFKDDVVFVDKNTITNVLYEGYSDAESDEFRAKLRDYMRTPRV